MKLNTSKTIVWAFLCLAGLWTQLQAQNTTVREQVYFDTGDYELSEEGRSVLDALIAQGASQVIHGVKVAGHTDAVGSDEANRILSKKRALTVARYLRDHGVNASVVKLKAFGEMKAVADNDTYQGRKLNRRVELKIYLGAMKELEEAVVFTCPNLKYTAEEEVVQANEGNYDCENGLVLQGKRGVSIEVPGGAFDGCDESGDITIKLGEYTEFDYVVGKNVSTMAGDTLLESAGMICLSAYANNRQISEIAEGKYVTVKIPAERFDPGMRLYFSNQSRDVTSITWTSTPSAPLAYDEASDSYIFKTNDLSCINLDKPAVNPEVMPFAIQVKKRMLRNSNMYMAYQGRGTFTQGRVKGKRYIVFGSVPMDEDVRLKGFLSTGRQLYKVDKHLSAEDRLGQTIALEGKSYQLVANVNRRGINRGDKFVGGKGPVVPSFGDMGAVDD